MASTSHQQGLVARLGQHRHDLCGEAALIVIGIAHVRLAQLGQRGSSVGMAASTESGDSVLAGLAAIVRAERLEPRCAYGRRRFGFFRRCRPNTARENRNIRPRSRIGVIGFGRRRQFMPVHVFLPRGPPCGQNISAEGVAVNGGPGWGKRLPAWAIFS
jgi:hypothetical protein